MRKNTREDVGLPRSLSRAHHAWSSLDNFQWAKGYTERYGLIYTGFRTQQRIIKDSEHRYSRVAASNCLDV